MLEVRETMSTESVSANIEMLIDLVGSLPTFNGIERTEVKPTDRRSKCKLNDLTASERAAFLLWGNFSMESNGDDDGGVLVLDESKRAFSKKGLKRAIRSYFESLNRSKQSKMARKRKKERKSLQRASSSMASSTKKRKFRMLRGKKLRDHVQQKLAKHPEAPHIVLDCRFDQLMDHRVFMLSFCIKNSGFD